MQHNRSRRGNSFQERDSEGRFTSSHNQGRGRDYNDDRGQGNRSQYRNAYRNEDNYQDYPRNSDHEYNRNEDTYNQYQYDRDYRHLNERDNDYNQYNQGRYNQRDEYNNYNNQYNDQYGRQNVGYRDYDDYNRRDYNDYNMNDRRRGGYDQQGQWNVGHNYQDYEMNRSYDRNPDHGMDYDRYNNGGGRGRDMEGGSHHGDYSHRGFASMPKSEVRRIASMGGRASHGGQSHRRGGRVSARRRSRSTR
jgi:hypothetical protein